MTSNGNELSERELEILRLLATGATNKEIAQKLYISTNTVKVHLRNIFSKIEVSTRTEAAMYAVNIGIVDRLQIQNGNTGTIPVGEDRAALLTSTGAATEAGFRWYVRKFTEMPWLLVVLVFGLLVILTTFLVLGELRRQNALENQPSEIEISSGNQQLWSLKAHLPTPRAQLAVVPYQDKLLTFAGLSENGAAGVVEQYDIPTDQWNTLAEKPLKVAGVQGVVIDDRVYIPGGKLDDGSPTDVLEIYNITDNTWAQGANLPIAVSDYGLAALNGKAYLMGGWDGENILNSVFEYDPEADRWVPIAPMLTARSQFGAVVINGKIFVFGGFDGKNALALTEVYAPGEDGNSGAWKSAAPMPHSGYGMGATSLLDIAYLIGGDDLSKKEFPILVFYTGSEEWQSIELPEDYHLGSTMGVTSQGQYLYMMGGIKDDALLENLYSYKALITTSLPLIIK